jgi:hypothetical protein
MKSKYYTLVAIWVVMSTFLVSVSWSLDLDNLPQQKGPKITKETFKERVTKKLLFDILEKRFKTPTDLSYKYSYMEWPRSFDEFIAVDRNGNAVNTGDKYRDFDDQENICPLSSEFVFTMVLINSYGYQPKADMAEYAMGRAAEQFSEFIGNLVAYYRSLASKNDSGAIKSLETISSTLNAWKAGHFNEEEFGQLTPALLALVKDYDKMLENLTNAYIADSDRKKAKLEENTKKAAEVAIQKHRTQLDALVKKYASFGAPPEMLRASLRTYAGAVSSGDLGTLAEFIDKVHGSKRWENKDSLFMLHQTTKDEMSGKQHKVLWGFKDLRKDRGCIWLDRVLIDNEEVPSSQLMYLVLKVLGM